jgi:hypothetical protein
MAIKDIELAMAEDLSKETREKYGLPETGMVIIEIKNPDLRQNIIAVPSGGMREYFLSHGAFNDVSLNLS